jgi:hypothetical protein
LLTSPKLNLSAKRQNFQVWGIEFFIHDFITLESDQVCIALSDLTTGTHDFQNIQIYLLNSSQIQVSGVFVQGASAVGILIIVYRLDHVNLSSVYYFEALETTITNAITTTVTGLSDGHYGISIFILEDNGLPFHRSASAPKSLFVQNGKGQIMCTVITCGCFLFY